MDYLDRGEVEHAGGGRDGGEVGSRVEPSVLLLGGPWGQEQLVKRNSLLINKFDILIHPLQTFAKNCWLLLVKILHYSALVKGTKYSKTKSIIHFIHTSC